MKIKNITKENYSKTETPVCMSFFSSLIGGITTDPDLMNIPIDDHLVQRGDGIFEAMRVIKGEAYHLKAHLSRLSFSAQKIGLEVQCTHGEIEQIIKECILAAKVQTAVIRLFVSRGVGSFSVSPYSTTGSQLYVAVTALSLPDNSMYKMGTKVCLSKMLPKLSPFANIKSCNYLPNVMMKKEAIDNGAEFALSFDAEGFLAEGATENVLVLTKNLELITPSHNKTLEGTTLNTVLKLAENLNLKAIAHKDISKKDLLEAKEVMLCSTVLEVLPVSQIFESGSSEKVNWKEFDIAKKLRVLLQKDMGTV